MRKLSILKATVDLLWIFSTPIILILLSFSIAIFFIDLGEFNIEMNSVNFNENDMLSKVLFAISSLNYLLIIAALYFFRKVLNSFIRVKIFEETVSKLFKKIGNLLIISGFISLIISIISTIYFEQKVTLEFSLNQHLVIICLGLFFLILSEIFKIATSAKQENDLTI
ncbi:DUF2975 domain-containing protein [Polaribacter glomeratus]|uniref:DUF2975 domain-containing protein n=1 Tax=Polaribacter glomeratus TaxID=102 RepID=A0A2S7WID1_9FLAO|nr:DUF2975 domain-containing protein [Polaribacter glomeratus]PQJ77369.1 hypothetical protein BTO16_16190 [Polaribacter glomeratus]TXD65956.1 DUF2975 domain-containing protein [Polaribacter glomeratus]